MSKILRVAFHAYRRHIFRGAFLLFNFGLPVFYMILLGVVLVFILRLQYADRRPVGLVSASPLVVFRDLPQTPIEFQAFADEAAAATALDAGLVQAYYLFPADYAETGEVIEVAPQPPSTVIRQELDAIARRSLLAATSPALRTRIENGLLFLYRATDSNDFTYQSILKNAIAGVMILAFYFSGFFTNTYLSAALAEEHGNRMAEILMTSMRAEQLLAGKIIGMVALGLTPLVLWASMAGLLGVAVLGVLNAAGLTLSLTIPWSLIGLCLALFFPAMMLNATLAALAGAVIGIGGTALRFIGTLTGFFSLLWAPALSVALSSPAIPLSVFFSLFPFTAAIVLPVRIVQVEVPLWETIASVSVLWLAALLSVIVAARLYRAIWLMTGQKHQLRSLLWALLGK